MYFIISGGDAVIYMDNVACRAYDQIAALDLIFAQVHCKMNGSLYTEQHDIAV